MNKQALAEPPQRITKLKFSGYKLGYTLTDEYTVFRFFCPRADNAKVELFSSYEQEEGIKFDMLKDDDGIWNIAIYENLADKWYGYRIEAPDGLSNFLYTDDLVADPFCKLATTQNTYKQDPKSKIITPEKLSFNWNGDDFVNIEDPRDLIIYECHLKDMSIHKSAQCKKPGTYRGFIDPSQKGGIQHLKDLGVNAVEFLPLQKFSYYEPPYKSITPEGFHNTWNPYSKNYWGYMTSFFFCPETIYGTNGSNEHKKIVGKTVSSITEFKQIVKALHKADIAVFMDVVYNHVSQYDKNPLKFMDLEYFFHIDHEGNLRSNSGTGNDFKTYQPVARQLILESLKYWVSEFHVDGFRFDLANMIDIETIDTIRDELRQIHPGIQLIAEPWGDGYNPQQFSEHEWAAWNDQIRNGVKGSDPSKDKGFIFGEWQHNTNRQSLENFFRGTLINYENGRFQDSAHSVNYLEAHDGYTLADFIRIALNPKNQHKQITNIKEFTKLKGRQLKIAKLAALYLFSSQGITMIHEGQEWARSKVIQPEGVKDPDMGRVDHNSYEKDNPTNYLNFDEIAINKSLYKYYQGMIELRKNAPALRKAKHNSINFHVFNDPLHVTFSIDGTSCGDPYNYFISLNANPNQFHHIDLPDGYWELLVNGELAGTEPIISTCGSLLVDNTSGVILRKLRD